MGTTANDSWQRGTGWGLLLTLPGTLQRTKAKDVPWTTFFSAFVSAHDLAVAHHRLLGPGRQAAG